MKKAYIFGCSHAAGSEMFDHDLDQEYTHSYPALIARDLGYEIHNHAIPGGSNDAVFRILMDIHHEIDSQDLVIFCWTGPDRCEFFSEEADQWLQFAVGRDVFNETIPHPVALQGQFVGSMIPNASTWQQFFGLWQRLCLSPRSVNSYANRTRNVVAANCLAAQRTSNVLNLTSFGRYFDDHWPLVEHWNWPIGRQEFCQWALERRSAHTAWGHFGLDTHRAFADHVMVNIRNVDSAC